MTTKKANPRTLILRVNKKCMNFEGNLNNDTFIGIGEQTEELNIQGDCTRWFGGR